MGYGVLDGRCHPDSPGECGAGCTGLSEGPHDAPRDQCGCVRGMQGLGGCGNTQL